LHLANRIWKKSKREYRT